MLFRTLVFLLLVYLATRFIRRLWGYVRRILSRQAPPPPTQVPPHRRPAPPARQPDIEDAEWEDVT